MSSIRVLLVENHTLVRMGFRALLESLEGVEVVGEASNGREALEMIKHYQPDIVLMDIAMEGMNGLEVAVRAGQLWPQVRIVMLSMYANEEYVWEALHAGAVGYLLKDADQFELENAVRAVARGESYLSARVSQEAVEAYMERVKSEPSPFARLTARQREVLQLIAEGYTTQEIGGILQISAKTVETHRAQVMQRLGIYDVPGLVRYAIRMGLVSPNE